MFAHFFAPLCGFSSGVFALLQAYAFLQYLKDRLTRQEFQTLFFLGVSLAAGVVFLTVIYLTYTGLSADMVSVVISFGWKQIRNSPETWQKTCLNHCSRILEGIYSSIGFWSFMHYHPPRLWNTQWYHVYIAWIDLPSQANKRYNNIVITVKGFEMKLIHIV